MKNGKGSTTLRMVADEVGLHPSTVSRILRGEELRGSPQTKERVFRAAESLGYRPNLAARSLRTQRSFALGYVIPDVRDAASASIYMGAEGAARRRGYHVVISPVDADRLHHKEHFDFLKGRGVDGMLIGTSRLRDPLVEQLERAGTQFVLVSRRTADETAPRVVADNLAGGRLATQHLIELGHRRVALISGTPDASTSEGRMAGYRVALENAGLSLDDLLIGGGRFDVDVAADATRSLLRNREPPTAIVVVDDMMAVAVIRELTAHGLSVPEDVSVTGFNDLPVAALAAPPLTTVRVPLERMGGLATDMLIDRIEGREPTANIVLDPELVVRSSTAPPRP